MTPRFLLFTLAAASASPGRFKSIFYQAHGQTATQIGFLIAIEIIIAVPATLFFAHQADRARQRKQVIYPLQALSLIVFLAQFPALASLHWFSPLQAFALITCTSLLLGLLHGPLFSIVYAISIAYLRAQVGSHGSTQFSKERIWGSLSWGIHSFLLGLFLDIHAVGPYAVYGFFTLFSLLFLIVVYFFQEKIPASESSLIQKPDREGEHVLVGNQAISENEDTDDIQSESDYFIGSALAVLCKGQFEDIFFVGIYFCLSIGMAVVENLLFLVLVNDLGASNTLCGSSVLIMTILELPVYSVMPYLLNNYAGDKLMLVAAAAYVVRVVWYTIMPAAWTALFVEPLHGVTFAIVDAASVEYAARRTLGDSEATAQSLFMVIRAAGLAVGTVVGGFVIDHFGAKAMYLGCATLITVASVVYVIVPKSTLTRQ